jgi:hypothetical protein
MPSREFKENFVVGGCFTLSFIVFVVVLASFRLWFLLPAFIIGWILVLVQSVRMGVWKRRGPGDGGDKETRGD